MNLDQYLKSRALSQTEFAEVLGVTRGIVSHWIGGRAPVPAERAADIERATRGVVTRMDLRPDVFGKLRKWRRPSLT
jgi:DNA-binding transcriptional regulator YdaS (Cro superfamily)